MSGDGLNRAQRTAVTTLEGPLLVLAGAGSGKTRVITFRIAELIASGIKPSRILAVTFTNKAAREMRERARKLLDERARQKRRESGKGRSRQAKDAGPEISTFHSLCVRVLRRNAHVLGYSENFTIYDRGDQESACRAALRDIRVGHQKLRPSDLLNLIGGWKTAGLSPGDAENAAKNDLELLGAHAYAKYRAQLRASNAMDFDDLLLLTVELLEKHPEVRFAEASRFDHLLIDEYQDTNGLQYRIVRALAERHKNLCVVGDDDQSIYGWRGAEVEHILHFANNWPGTRVVELVENYRSTEWILHLSNTLIKHNSERHQKQLIAARGRGHVPRFIRHEDETAEAESIVIDIHTKITREDEERVPASDIAILFRTNEQPRAFEQELRRAGVPYVLIGGQSFYDRKEIKDLLGYLRVLSNPQDEVSLLRIINTPARGIGTSSIQALLDQAVNAGEALWKLLPKADHIDGVTPAARIAVEGFVHLIGEFRARMQRESLSAVVRELIVRVDYKSELERTYKDPGELEARWNAVEEFVNAVSVYESRTEMPSLSGFLEESALASGDDDKDDDKRKEHSITLMTLHSAKGLEFPIVYLVGLEEGFLPHKRSVLDERSRAIEEERRLAYVGITRAQDQLTLSYCKNRLKWGKLRPQLPSRFLFEMRGETDKAREVGILAAEAIRKSADGDDGDGGKTGRGDKAGKEKKGEKPERREKAPSEQTPRQDRAPRRDPVKPPKKVPVKSAPFPSHEPRPAPPGADAPGAADLRPSPLSSGHRGRGPRPIGVDTSKAFPTSSPPTPPPDRQAPPEPPGPSSSPAAGAAAASPESALPRQQSLFGD